MTKGTAAGGRILAIEVRTQEALEEARGRQHSGGWLGLAIKSSRSIKQASQISF